MADEIEKIYEFYGTATVSVSTRVEATSEAGARALVDCGDCEWQCECVDGNVENIELIDGEYAAVSELARRLGVADV